MNLSQPAPRFFGHTLPARQSCSDCGDELVRCEGDDDAERVFVCLTCRTETVAVANLRPATRTRSLRRRLVRRTR